jgi:hypothetical protein
VDGTGLGSCPMAGFGFSSVKHLESSAKEFMYLVDLYSENAQL